MMTCRCFRISIFVLTFLCAPLLVFEPAVRAQFASPIISGGVGFISTTNNGSTVMQPVIAPVIAAPFGDRWLFESRADLRGVIFQPNLASPYEGQFFDTLEYAQVDYNAASWLTIVAGRFLTPFNMYNERFTPIWIRDLQDAPIIFAIGTRTNGYSDGFMARGVAVSRKSYQVTYSAYFSTLSTIDKLEAGRAAGGRLAIFFPEKRLEIGTSYQKLLQDQRTDSVGAYFSWQPAGAAFTTRGEYAHSLFGQGYWVSGAYRFSRFHGPDSLVGRIQAVGRVQQYVHTRIDPSGSLPSTDRERAEFGLNYYLPKEVRFDMSYGRQFSPIGDANVWNFAVTYRFLFPLFPGTRGGSK